MKRRLEHWKWNLVVAEWTNFQELLDNEIWAFSRESDLKRFTEGTQAIVYLVSRQGPYSAVAAQIESKGELEGPSGQGGWFPFRASIRVCTMANPIPVAPMINRLSFVPKGPAWGLAFRGHAIRRIPEPDFRLLAEALEAAGPSRDLVHRQGIGTENERDLPLPLTIPPLIT